MLSETELELPPSALRHLQRAATAPAAPPMTGDDIRAIREHAHSAKRPTGAALVLLNVGIAASFLRSLADHPVPLQTQVGAWIIGHC
jgi:hypothetical protein